MTNPLSPSSTVTVDELAESLSQATLGLECKQFEIRWIPRRPVRAPAQATVTAAPLAALTVELASESSASTAPLLDATGLDFSNLEPLSLLSMLSELVMPKVLFNLVLDELDIAIESQDSVFKVIMLGLAKRVREICEDESEKMWNDKIKKKLFADNCPLLQDLVSMTDFKVLMIGENPTLSSAVGVIGVRKSTINHRATGLKEFDVPFNEVLNTHLGRQGKDKSQVDIEEHRILSSIRETYTSNEIESSPSFSLLDARYPHYYHRTDFLYDIVSVTVSIRPPTKRAPRREKRRFTIFITNPRYTPRYDLAQLIDASKGDYQYLGANHFIEQNILKFGYRHARRMESFYEDIHRFHNGLKDDLRAHVFLLKRRGI
ncbi:hypothetical protein JCM5353_003145 [Sporobolomyces roseus]